jgi:hypothetical protein
MIEVPTGANRHDGIFRRKHVGKPVNAWTVMLLTSPLFISRGSSTPPCMDAPMHAIALELLRTCFQELRERWDSLRDHLESLLDERYALLNPAEHDKLLWDDEVFSRSRSYFWAIHCLSEFQISINDNIVQWENYRTARILPLLDAGKLEPEDKSSLKDIDTTIVILKELRSYFSEKLTSTKALRDGVSIFALLTIR